MTIRPAHPAELEQLTAICMRSKAHWGYSPAFMAACAAELAVTTADLARDHVVVSESDGRPAAVAQLALDGAQAVLVRLFVDPASLRCGHGRRLWDWAVDRAARSGARVLVLDADPYAEAFYHRLGAVTTGQVPSTTWPGRMLPRIEMPLSGAGNR
ncbi:GNAT family N-acetyltransferase [Paracoccus pacificus]|uniref:GNAT family N-acetyltransferase n=1 Tax=Paracoccus pacificus TaxID=1463598 RepID=A0ABW4R8H4_9RHOB